MPVNYLQCFTFIYHIWDYCRPHFAPVPEKPPDEAIVVCLNYECVLCMLRTATKCLTCYTSPVTAATKVIIFEAKIEKSEKATFRGRINLLEVGASKKLQHKVFDFD